MTTLPATYAEAAAAEGVRIALEWIAEHSGPTGVFGPFGDQLYGRITMKMWAQAHPLGADDIIYLAETGSHEAQAALVEVISERSARNEPLGALGAYNTRCHRRGPPRKRGPKAMDNFVRDVGIFSLLCKLRRQLNLKPNFNAGSKMPCASVIAAQALAAAGIVHLTPKAVEKIWERYLPVEAGTPLAVGTKFAAGWPATYPGLFA